MGGGVTPQGLLPSTHNPGKHEDFLFFFKIRFLFAESEVETAAFGFHTSSCQEAWDRFVKVLQRDVCSDFELLRCFYLLLSTESAQIVVLLDLSGFNPYLCASLEKNSAGQ